MELIEPALTGVGVLLLALGYFKKVSEPKSSQGLAIFIWGFLGPDFFSLNHSIDLFALHSSISLFAFGLIFSLVLILSSNTRDQYFVFLFFYAHGLHLFFDFLALG